MKILLLGSNGQVGWEINRQARAAGLDIIALNRRELDITKYNDVKQKVGEIKPNILINATAYTAVDQAEKEPELAFEVNRDAVRNLAQVCDLNDMAMIHFSTDYIFDGKKSEPYVETDPANPLNVYGESKWQGEEALRRYLEKYIILRISWVFGQHGNNFVKTIIKLASEKKELRVIADQYGCPTPAEDVAANVLRLVRGSGNQAAKSRLGVFHYCGMPATTWYDFAKKIVDFRKEHFSIVCESIIPIKTEEYKTLAQRPKYSVLNCSKVVESTYFFASRWENKIKSMIRFTQ